MYRHKKIGIERFSSVPRPAAIAVLLACLLLASCGSDEKTAAGGDNRTGVVPPLPAIHDEVLDPEVYASASHILIPYAGCRGTGPEDTRTRDEAGDLAARVAFYARSDGADFVELVHEYSEATKAMENDGYLGIFGRGTMDMAFEGAVFLMKPGMVGEVVETEWGFHVLKREFIRGAYLRHILIGWEGAAGRSATALRSRAEAEALAREIQLQAADPKADFCDLARRYSDDTDSRGNCGNLGMIYRGGLDPVIEKAGFRLRPGGVSPVVETDYGFHIIRREK